MMLTWLHELKQNIQDLEKAEKGAQFKCSNKTHSFPSLYIPIGKLFPQ